MHKYTAKLSLLLLIILEASIYDEGVLSEGVLSGRSLCLDGVMYGGGFVRGVLSEGVLSGGGFVLPLIEYVEQLFNFISYSWNLGNLTMQTIVIIMVDHYNKEYDLVGNTSMTIITMLVLINIIGYFNLFMTAITT